MNIIDVNPHASHILWYGWNAHRLKKLIWPGHADDIPYIAGFHENKFLITPLNYSPAFFLLARMSQMLFIYY